jgi:tetratricopeptide (TPR) repeat protein
LGAILSLNLCVAACTVVLCLFFGATAAAQFASGQTALSQAGAASTSSTPAVSGLDQLARTQQAERKAYSSKVSGSYNYHFGKDRPFTPGNAGTEDGNFIQPGAFPRPEYCQHCHQEAYHLWRQALKSNAFRDPFYRTSVNILTKDKGIEFTRHCNSCHSPVGMVTGVFTQDGQADRGELDHNGLTCMTCHSITSVKSTSGNGGYVMAVPSVLLDEKGNRIPGEVPYADILAHPERHSAAIMRPLLHTAEFCASCHKTNLPVELNDFKFVRADTVFDEWQNSKFSNRNPLTFYTAEFKTCQDCHMKRAPLNLPDVGAKNGTFASHSWLAGNTAVPYYYGYTEQLQKTIKFLQSGDFLNVDIFALKKSNEDKLIAPLGSVPFRVQPNDVLDTYVVIQNKGIGHSLIPEIRDIAQAWVEFIVQDPAGRTLYHSGFLDAQGMLDATAHSFTSRPVDEAHEFVDNHKVFTIHEIAYNNSIEAGRSVLIRYQFRVPADIKGQIIITAKVQYRHLRQSYFNNVLGKDHPSYPVIEVASRTRTLNIGNNQPVKPEPGDNQDWMRWNNIGIAYLDQQQYAEAVGAFEQVVKLRPDYPDAYTNIAVVEMPWEKYDSAWVNIQKALSLSPKNARALYYAGLIERRMSHPDEAMADLAEVVKQFPESRDARRELGVSFFQKHQYGEAMGEFEKLQQIDPDDNTAHYYLSILYRRMNRQKEAEDQQALFITEKVNSEARTLSLDFLRRYPEIAEESIPWHVHVLEPMPLPHLASAPGQ